MRRSFPSLEGSTAAYTAALRGGSTMVRSDAARLEQQRSALRAANEARSYRRDVKERLAAGELAVADVLVDPQAARMTVGDVLFALPGVGRVKRERVLRWAALSPFKEVGALTPNGRSRLLRGLALHGGASAESHGRAECDG